MEQMAPLIEHFVLVNVWDSAPCRARVFRISNVLTIEHSRDRGANRILRSRFHLRRGASAIFGRGGASAGESSAHWRGV